ncbi:alpha/beta hydrolase [Ornithinimicrobium murale]|uniref:alpha/beta hydrolase n=1 Tax=Ornithinimicrobium murale TaxID=1050153 RepID=UPI00192DE46A|nr:alpha/beta hydrolase [Ornithinimicrobium murale]
MSAVAGSSETDTAVEPATTGVTVRDGVELAWRTYGSGSRTVLLLPTWQIIDSRFWKAQVGHLSRHFRVVTFDGRGTGASGHPTGATAYSNDECAADVTAVLDATGTERAVLVALSCAATWAIQTAADHPDRVDGVLALSPSCGVTVSQPGREAHAFDQRLDVTHGWAKYNQHYWTEGHFADFRDFFFHQMFSEPHSTKQLEDALRWSEQTDPQTLVDATLGRLACGGAVCRSVEDACRQVTCPVLVVHGTDDRVRSEAVGRRVAELTGGRLVLVEGGGHGLMSRSPVKINRLIHEFVTTACAPAVPTREQSGEPTTWTFAPTRRRRVLYLSSPIGLGHAARDLAVVQELRRLEPDVEVDWLAQHPVTTVLEAAGERVHPASGWLSSESSHVEHECGEHDLHAFQAIRRMDAILVHNFMVFQDLVAAEHYDLVVGDESWDVDYFLHENPELKAFNFAWMTDFVGWLPMPDGGPEEAALTADYNAEMIEQRARFARVRDRSIFVGSPEDVVPASFGDGLPQIPDWVGKNFDFAGYVTGFDPATLPERDELRQRLGMPERERVCLVTVGGTGVGRPLLERVLETIPLARRAAPDLRFLVVTGPRIDPRSLPRRRGTSIRGFLPGLYQHLAAADLALVQGGLTSCMELTAARRPFLYVPLRHHFEQNFHVRHRLERYGAGRHLPYEQAVDPDALAAAILDELDREVDYRPVETDGAARAAAMLAELL